MGKMIIFGLIIFLMTYGGVKSLQSLNVFEFESLLKEVSFTAGIAGVVMLVIASIVILF